METHYHPYVLLHSIVYPTLKAGKGFFQLPVDYKYALKFKACLYVWLCRLIFKSVFVCGYPRNQSPCAHIIWDRQCEKLPCSTHCQCIVVGSNAHMELLKSGAVSIQISTSSPLCLFGPMRTLLCRNLKLRGVVQQYIITSRVLNLLLWTVECGLWVLSLEPITWAVAVYPGTVRH